MSDPALSSTAWPAARPTGISPIQHPAWEEARNAILDLAAEGPVTAVIVGEPGTGKTWLLRELAASLGEHGFPTMMLMQGNLPMTLSSGAALLVDDAALMADETRAQLSAQQHGVVVLAAAEWLEQSAAPNPVIIPLRPLAPAEIAEFAAEWLRRSGSPATPDDATLSQLVAHSRGRVGPLVLLLREAVASWQQPRIVPPEPAAPDPLPLVPPRRRSLYRPLLVGSAIAATIVLGWAFTPAPPPARVAQSAAPPAAAAPLPAIRNADTPNPAIVTASIPTQPPITALPVVPAPLPELRAGSIPLAIPTPHPIIAAATPPPVLPLAEPMLVATLEDPADIPETPRRRPGGPGLVLVAQRGDTLESLYGSVYRDRHAPPFANVVAANPGPVKPGAIVVFPEPPGGWQRLQH